jgi:DNA repair photolyase
MAKIPHQPRGALANPAGRFEKHEDQAVEDGWWQDEDLPPLRTTVAIDASKSVIVHQTSPDIPFEQSINPYRGCEHGCVYCFARPTHNYLGLSSGVDFETKLFAKPNAAEQLRVELRHPGYRCAPIALGTNTDPYQPIERRYKIMRSILEVLWEFRHPVMITTKSANVLRDADLLGPMARQGLARVMISVTTLDGDLARRLEPRASAPQRRLAAIKGLSEAGVPVMVMAAPIIPALTDMELENILQAARENGAQHAGWTLIRLPYDVKELFDQWLAHHRPDRRDHVLSLIRQARGGKLNNSEFKKRFTGDGPYIAMLRQRFHLACRKLDLNLERAPLRSDLFRRPPQAGDQLALDLGA